MSSEIKLISTLQKDNESLRNENRELKKELESYKRKIEDSDSLGQP